MDNNQEISEANLKNLSSSRICFIGLGTASSRSIDQIAQSDGHPEIAYISIDLTRDVLLECPSNNYCRVGLTQQQVETSLQCNLSDSSDSDSNLHASNVISELKQLLDHFESVFVCANLGRCSGSLLSILVGKIAEIIHTPFYGIKSLPLNMEGSARKKKAESVIANIQDSYEQLVLIPSQVCFQALERRPKLPADFYPLIDARYFAFHGMLKELINGPNILPIGLPDFESILSLGEKGHPLFFTARGTGESALSSILSEAKGNLQIDSWNSSHRVSDILLFCNATGGLSCESIDLLVESVDRIFPDSQTLVGATEKISESSDEIILEVVLLAIQREDCPAEVDRQIDPLVTASGADTHLLPDQSQYVSDENQLRRGQMDDDLHSEFSPPYHQNSNSDRLVIEPLESSGSTQADIPQPDFSSVEDTAYIAPAPHLNAELKEEILKQKKRAGKRKEVKQIETLQEQLPLAIISRGRFEGTEESVYSGQDLDIPTFIRKGIVIR